MLKRFLLFLILSFSIISCAQIEQNNDQLEDGKDETLVENNSEEQEKKDDKEVVENFEEKTLYIDHYINSVFGFHEGLSYRVKENEEDNWESLYEGIEGFEYELGYVYIIRVKIFQVENPPADGSSLRYEFVELLSKEVNTNDFSITLKRDSYNWIDNNEEGLALLYYCSIITTDDLKEELLTKLNDDTITKVDGLFRHTDEYRTIELVGIEVE